MANTCGENDLLANSPKETSTVNSSTETPNERFVCSFKNCYLVFSRADRLLCHERVHSGERPYVCDFVDCGKEYARSAHLQRHMLQCHGSSVKKSLKCIYDDCDQMFVSNDNLKKHIKRIHEKEYKFQCKNCNKIFKKHQQLRIHEHVHTGVKPFSCTEEGCGRSFLLPSKLKAHQKIHKGYKCHYEGCSEVVTKWSLLRKHIATKHKAGYLCNICGERVVKKDAMRRHMSWHEKSRDAFSCPQDGCSRKYFDKKNLVAHIKSYHDGLKFTCAVEGCDRKFATKQKLHDHKQLHNSSLTKLKKKPPKKRAQGVPLASKLSGHLAAATTKIADINNADLSIILPSSTGNHGYCRRPILQPTDTENTVEAPTPSLIQKQTSTPDLTEQVSALAVMSNNEASTEINDGIESCNFVRSGKISYRVGFSVKNIFTGLGKSYTNLKKPVDR